MTQDIEKQRFLEGCARLGVSVSSVQLYQLEIYAESLKKWQKSVNLVGPKTIDELWTRHLLDGAQLVPLVSRGTILDFGAGAGLPSVPLAILSGASVTACERIAKKTGFISFVSRETGLGDRLRVVNDDVRNLSAHFDVITARAVADLGELLLLTKHLNHEDTCYVFPKGGNVNKEISSALLNWKMTIEKFPSITNSDGTILRLSHVGPVTRK